jgi:aryl-alcohol dehydrogenase-like predicted oxidoreductase
MPAGGERRGARSLKRLRTDYLDVYLLIGEAIRRLRKPSRR